MAHSRSPIAQFGEVAENIAREPMNDVKKQVFDNFEISLLYGGESARMSDANLKEKKRLDNMMKHKAYREKLGSFGLKPKQPIEELTITEEQREGIEKTKESYRGFENDSKQMAQNLGQGETIEQRRNREARLAASEEQLQGNEIPALGEMGSPETKGRTKQKFNRKSMIRQAMTKRETKAGQGIGG